MAETSPFSLTRIAGLATNYAPRTFEKSDLLGADYLLASEGQHSVYFAPLGTVPAPGSRLILVGLTPGLSQVTVAARLFAKTSPSIRNDAVAYRELVREHVAFRGSMRSNLCLMLDALGFPKYLGVTRSEELFEGTNTLLATTSSLVYPVFTGPELRNFSGTHELGRVALFRRMLDELLAPRLEAASGALIVPFGRAAASGIRYLMESGKISAQRVLTGFPHPSGANGHRKSEFEEGRERMRAAVRDWFASPPVVA